MHLTMLWASVLTQHGHPVAYHSETLSDTVRKYPTYDKEMYSIVQSCRQWKHYIMGKEMIIHTDHKPLQFIQTQGKLQNDRHQKWSTYLQQFHLNIKYKTGISNRVVDCLSWPPMAALTTVLHSCGHEASEWPQLYQQDPNFTTTYQLLGTGATVTDFHIQDGILCHLGPSLCSYKRVCKDDLGSPLQSGGRTFWHRENCGHSSETFLLAKTSTGRQQVYQILHYLCHFQANHQEARLIHPSSYSREALGIHLNGLHVWFVIHQARK
jgi:hypothetical protein